MPKPLLMSAQAGATLVSHLAAAVCARIFRPIQVGWVTPVKTTIELPDDLLARSKAVARLLNSTIKALLEDGLRLAGRERALAHGTVCGAATFG